MKYQQDRPYSRGTKLPYHIGVFSLHPHAGATYVSVLLAEYLANVIGYKTAVIENSFRGDLFSLQAQGKQLSNDLSFKLHEITYSCYNSCHMQNVHMIQGFDCYVKDLGNSYARARELIETCDLTFLIFTMTPWYCDFASLTDKLKKDYGNNTKLCILGNQIPINQRKQLYKQLHCEFLDYEPNMFWPSVKAVQMFHKVIWHY